MKTIKTEQEIEALEVNDYHKEGLKQMLKEAQSIGQFAPCKLQYDKISENYYLILDEEDDIHINKNYKGEYGIFSWRSYDYMDSYNKQQIRNLEESPKEPKNFKVLSKKNLENWIKYTKEINKLYKEKSETLTAKVNKFKQDINALATQKNVKKHHIKEEEKEFSGYIDTKNFSMTFNILNNGYCEVKTRLNYSEKTYLEQFQELVQKDV